MSKLSILIVALVLAAANAFVVAPSSRLSVAAPTKSSPVVLNMAEDTYWEGEYPPSKVLGPIMSKMPSGVLGVLSLVFLSACAFSCFETTLLLRQPGAVESGNWVQWQYVLMGLGGPLSWGTHVASWIQRKNGM
jgi:hypothetical protein